MSEEQAYERVYEALSSVDPNWRGQPMSPGAVGVRLLERGVLWDVLLTQADRLFPTFERAIRTALGSHCGTVTDQG